MSKKIVEIKGGKGDLKMVRINKKDVEKFSVELFDNMLDIFDLLNNTELLECFLERLNEKQKEKLYSHPLLEEYDLLP